MKYTLLVILAFGVIGCGKDPTTSSTSTAAQPENGINGLDGAQGTAGAPGSTISKGIYCSQIDSSVGATIVGIYQSVLYSTGHRSVSCSIVTQAMQLTSNRMYGPNDPEVNIGDCIVNYDLDTASGGYWKFTQPGTLPSFTYLDTNSIYSGHSRSFISNDCTTF